jgi:ubiquinone/menaquinone biosynthesis C-methylase UbiE
MKREKTVLRYLLIAVGIFALWQIVARLIRRLFPCPAPAALGIFLDSGLRKRLQPPDVVIDRSGLVPGMDVLEIGCGSGAFTTTAARVVGPEGSVAALDVQPGMLRQLARKLRAPEHRDIQNVRLHESDAQDLPFDACELDAVYMVTVLPEIPDQARALAEIRRVLKPGGVLAVTELLMDPDYPPAAETRRRGRAAGFEVVGTYGNLWSYTVRFRKPGAEAEG